MFFFVALIILWLIHGYVAWRILPTLSIPSAYVYWGYIFIFLLSLLPLLPILLRFTGSETKIIDRISLFGYTSLGFFVLSFLILLLKDLCMQIFGIFEHLFKSDFIADNSKREFLKKSLSISVIGVSGVGSIYGFHSSRKGPTIIEQNIFLENLPIEYDDFSIAQISDLHVGPTIKKNYVENVQKKNRSY